MIKKLTTEQEKKMIKIKNKWLDYIFSCKNSTNREQATIAIDWLYKFCGLNEPIIIYLESPLACQYAIPYLREIVKILPMDKNPLAQVWDQVGDQVWNQVWDQIRDQVGDQVWDQVRYQVWDQVWNQVWNQVGDQVWDQVR